MEVSSEDRSSLVVIFHLKERIKRRESQGDDAFKSAFPPSPPIVSVLISMLAG